MPPSLRRPYLVNASSSEEAHYSSPSQQPLSRSLNADVPEQLITPLVSLGHISMLAPDQFASPMKSIVANFIVKDLLMNDRVRGLHSSLMLLSSNVRWQVLVGCGVGGLLGTLGLVAN